MQLNLFVFLPFLAFSSLAEESNPSQLQNMATLGGVHESHASQNSLETKTSLASPSKTITTRRMLCLSLLELARVSLHESINQCYIFVNKNIKDMFSQISFSTKEYQYLSNFIHPD